MDSDEANMERRAGFMRRERSNDADLIRIVEAIYRIGAAPSDWLSGILRAAQPLMDEGLGLCAGTYDASGPALKVEAFVNLGNPVGSSERIEATSYEFTPEYVDAAFLGHVCEVASQVPGWDDLPFVRDKSLLAWNIRDRIGVNGLTTDGSGTILGIHLPERRCLSPVERRCYAKIAGHLGAAHRLRRRLVQGMAPADAVLSPQGHVAHAENSAKGAEALSRLSFMARSIDHARSEKGRRNREAALNQWRAMVSGRWTLVETFETDGRRYMLARQNAPDAPGPDLLTTRERQILSYALLGHHNKLIAYELGISDTTVRVLLHRAARKMGVESREALLTLGRTMMAEMRTCAPGPQTDSGRD
jgi:DNA-binding CsgD family transcriptional regulator